MKVAITGASGLIGSALRASLEADGHEVIALVRRAPTSSAEAEWNPKTGYVALESLNGVDAIVNLAGAGVGDHRWTDDYKQEIRDSRVLGTHTIAVAAANLTPKPRVLICGSAIGYYGDRGDEVLTEDSPPGSGFLADVVADWEAAADPARHAGIRVVNARTGLVVSRDGGAWQRMITLFKSGVGGRLGSGKQYWSFISIDDEVAALRFLIENDTLEGPVNLSAPNPVTNREATKDLAQALHRPAALPVPAFALKAALGEFSSEVLSSARVLPERLADAGFIWSAPTMRDALNQVL